MKTTNVNLAPAERKNRRLLAEEKNSLGYGQKMSPFELPLYPFELLFNGL